MTTAILISARLKSTRLKKKVIRQILGRPMIAHLIDRLKLSNEAGHIVLCTSTVEQDQPLRTIAASAGIGAFLGHPDDVLVRLRDAARQFDADEIVSCTADNPFIDPFHLDYLVRSGRERGLDYGIVRDLPFGITGHYVRREALEKACRIKDDVNTEFWPEYFTESGVFRIGEVEPMDPRFVRPDLRLTVDYAEDLALVTRVFEALYKEEGIFSLAQIIDFLDANPNVRSLNANMEQAPRDRPTLKPREEWRQLLA